MLSAHISTWITDLWSAAGCISRQADIGNPAEILLIWFARWIFTSTGNFPDPIKKASSDILFMVRTGFLFLLYLISLTISVLIRFLHILRFILPLFSYKFSKFLIFACDVSVILSFMRNFASGTILDPAVQESKIASTFISQCIQRTITEQTVEIIRICSCMAWEIFTFLMTVIWKFFPFPVWFLHACYLLPGLYTHDFSHKKRGSDATPG